MAFVEKAIFFTEGRGSMYLSELFLQVLEEKSDANAAQKALEVCNKEFCRQMNGVVDEKDCITYFFYTDENNDIIKPNDRYLHTATPSGRFCGRKWTRSGASGQFS